MLRTLLSRLENFWQGFSGAEKKLLLLFLSVLVLSTAALVIQNKYLGKAVPKFGGTYSEGLVGSPQHINPLLAPANDIDADLARIIYAGVLKFDPALNLAPDLAESFPEISASGKEYTIKLKGNLHWQDGVRLTADDLVFTYRLIQNPDYQSPLRLSWNRVEAEKIDDRTVKLITRESSAAFIANLTVGILPKHIWEQQTPEKFALSKFNLEPVGAGPFAISEIKRGRGGEIRQLVMKANKTYHGGGPYLKQIVFKFYKTTEELINAYHGRDVMALGYVPFDESLFIEPQRGLRQIFLQLPQYQAVFINRAKNPAPLEDVRVRTALAKSVDKQKILNKVYGGQAAEAYGPILPGHLGYHEQIPGADMNVYDEGRARALLEEAGWAVDPSASGGGFRKDKLGRTLSLSLATNNFPPNVRTAQVLKEIWERLGIQIVLNIETVADLEEKFIRPREYELLLFSENVGADPDPYPFWHSSQLRDPGLNLSTFSNKEADKLLVDARANIPAPERAAKYRKFQEIFVGDAPAVFLTRSVFVFNVPDGIKGLELNTVSTPADRFADINKWYIETKRIRK